MLRRNQLAGQRRGVGVIPGTGSRALPLPSLGLGPLEVEEALGEEEIVPLPVVQPKKPRGRAVRFRLGFKERLAEFVSAIEAAFGYLQPWLDEIRLADRLDVYKAATKSKTPLRWVRFEDHENLRGRFKLFFIHQKDGSVTFSDLVCEKRYRKGGAQH